MFLEKKKKKQKNFAHSQGVAIDLQVSNVYFCYLLK
jgi:hypothetical protein